ncbi:MAG: hypothetical protein LBL92_01155 [Propionibacteriaceae bacterium]|jgi:hypothetical protein|nr:hypothetical protein [Propionibacteriaceae bacterium]
MSHATDPISGGRIPTPTSPSETDTTQLPAASPISPTRPVAARALEPELASDSGSSGHPRRAYRSLSVSSTLFVTVVVLVGIVVLTAGYSLANWSEDADISLGTITTGQFSLAQVCGEDETAPDCQGYEMLIDDATVASGRGASSLMTTDTVCGPGTLNRLTEVFQADIDLEQPNVSNMTAWLSLTAKDASDWSTAVPAGGSATVSVYDADGTTPLETADGLTAVSLGDITQVSNFASYDSETGAYDPKDNPAAWLLPASGNYSVVYSYNLSCTPAFAGADLDHVILFERNVSLVQSREST